MDTYKDYQLIHYINDIIIHILGQLVTDIIIIDTNIDVLLMFMQYFKLDITAIEVVCRNIRSSLLDCNVIDWKINERLPSAFENIQNK